MTHQKWRFYQSMEEHDPIYLFNLCNAKLLMIK